MEFRLLGPLSVVAHGRELAVGGARERAVLAMLLLERGRTVSIDRLVDALWPDAPPKSARGQVHICISAVRRRLKQAGEPELVETRPPGYLLRIGEGQCDLDEFTRLTAEGRDHAEGNRQREAVLRLREALDLWRGEPFADVESRLVQAAVLGLAELRASVTEDWLDASLALGYHEEVIRETATLVTEYPLRERLRQQHVTALYRAGRAAEALSAYRQARDAFTDELGLDPSPQFQWLERAILTHDPALGAPGFERRAPNQPEVAVPRQLPPGSNDFTGRKDMIGRLLGALKPTGSEPPVVVLTGAAGVGKTALAVHVAHLMSDIFPDGQLFADLGSGGSRPATPGSVLERFLRALGLSAPEIPEETEDRAALYRSLLWGRKVLILLDDVGAESQVRDLLQGSAGSAVIITSRRRLTGVSGASQMEMSVLDAEEAADLLTALSGLRVDDTEASQAEVRSLLRLCAGLPLALRICAARLAARPHWTVSDLVARLTDEHRRLDELAHGELSVRPSISLSYDGLSAEARRLFRLAGLIEADEFSSWVAAPLLDMTIGAAEEVLDQLVDARMIEASTWHDATPPRYRMHELFRIYARERLAEEEPAAERSAALARFLGCLLWLSEEAHRREYGGDHTVMHSGAHRYQLENGIPAALLEQPLRWLERERPVIVTAISQAARLGLSEYAWDLAITSVTLFELGTYFADWRETNEIALAAVRKAGNRRGEAVMQYSRGALAIAEQNLGEAQTHLAVARQFFKELNDRYATALVQRNEAYIQRTVGLLSQAAGTYREVLDLLRLTDDPIAEAHTLSGLASIHIERGDLAAAEAALHRASSLCRDTSQRAMAQLTYRFGELYLARGDLDGAGTRFESVLDSVDNFRDKIGAAYARWGMGSVALGRGQLDEAESHVAAGLQLAGRMGERLIHGRLLLVLGHTHARRGRTAAAAAALGQAVGKFETLGAVLWRVRAMEALAVLYAETDDQAGARLLSGEALELLSSLPPADTGHLAARITERVAG